MGYGLVAALGWGVSSVAAAYAARRMGTLAALLTSQVIGAVVLGVVLADQRPHLVILSGDAVVGLIAAGLLTMVGWLTYYRALEHGPVGIVSGAAATYGGVTALLALLVLHEPLGKYGGIGAALAVAGVATAAARSSAEQPGRRRYRHAVRPPVLSGRAAVPGVLLALASALTYGTGAFWLGMYSASAGWLVSALIVYVVSVTVLAAALVCRQETPRRGAGGGIWAVAAGVTEAVAIVAFARGGQAGEVAVTAAVSSAYPVIPLLAGLAFFRERLSVVQVLGIFAAVAGLALVSVSGQSA
jgi:drug/metabolite transporter (DMT)-like permease